MPNITLALDERLLADGREYAHAHNDSLNGLVRRLLAQTVQGGDTSWLEECFQLMDRADAHSGGAVWTRDDIYDV